MARLFRPLAVGDGTAKAQALTTPPADANNVTQSRKICGSPPLRTFPHGRAVGNGNKKPQPKPGPGLVEA